jgi:DNA invertase Pin-like site-specific DNA recombinase
MTAALYDDLFEWLIYARISDDREGAGLGVQRQEDDARAFHGRGRLGGFVYRVLVDNDLSAYDKAGKYKPRPDYDLMCALLRERPGRRGVIAWHTDRLHRSPRELEDFIDLIEATGAPVHTVQAGLIDLSTASGRMTARVHCAVARHESEHRSERIRRKTEQLAAAGTIYGGGPRPFGYTRIYSGEGSRRKIVADEVNEAEAKIVRECARRFIDGESIYSIVRDLNNRGIRTSTGRAWTHQAMTYLLGSGRIGGMREHRRQIVGKAVWDPIVDEDTFKQLQTLIRKPRRTGTNPRKHYLTGFVACSDCVNRGVKMKPWVTVEGKVKYRCPPKGEGGCGGRTVNLPELEQLVGAYMVRRLTDKALLAELARRETVRTAETDLIIARIEADETRLEKLQASMTDGDADDLPEVVASVRVIRRRLAESRDRLAALARLPELVGEDLPGLAQRWPGLPLDRKRALLAAFVERVVISPAIRGLGRFDPRRVDIVPRQAV